MTRLTKRQALDLLPAVVDQEANEDERLAFLSFIAKNEDVQKQYESALRIKELLSSRYPRAKAPERLKQTIFYALSEEILEDVYQERELKDSPSGLPFHETNGRSSRVTSLLRSLSVTALILFLVLLTIDLLDRMAPAPFETYIVEQYAAEHLLNSDGYFAGPHYATQSTREAEQFVTDQYGMNVIIPDLKGTQFSGVMMADFYNGFEVPLLEYEQNGQNLPIYIFAFGVHELENNRFLQRYEQAVDQCKLHDDFFVLELGELHVVSWLWQDRWYTAVSKYNGYELASLIESPY